MYFLSPGRLHQSSKLTRYKLIFFFHVNKRPTQAANVAKWSTGILYQLYVLKSVNLNDMSHVEEVTG